MDPFRPFNRLAVELIRHIFLFVRGDVDLLWYHVDDSRSNLIMVCTHWREIIFGFTAMWTHIVLTMATRPAFLDYALEHAPRAGMTLYLDAVPVYYLPQRMANFRRRTESRAAQAFCDIFLPILLPNFYRFENFTATCIDQLFWRIIGDNLGQADARNLVRISLTMPTCIAKPGLYPILYFPPDSRLSELRLSGRPLLWKDAAVYERLTCLRLLRMKGGCRLDWDIFTTVVVAAPFLRILQLARVAWKKSSDLRRIELPTLASLYLDFDDGDTMAIMGFLHLPAIEDITVEVARSIPVALERLGHSLRAARKFHLTAPGCTVRELDELWPLLAQVKVLGLVEIPDSVLAHFVARVGANAYRLQSLDELVVGNVLSTSDLDTLCDTMLRVAPDPTRPATRIELIGRSREATVLAHLPVQQSTVGSSIASIWSRGSTLIGLASSRALPPHDMRTEAFLRLLHRNYISPSPCIPPADPRKADRDGSTAFRGASYGHSYFDVVYLDSEVEDGAALNTAPKSTALAIEERLWCKYNNRPGLLPAGAGEEGMTPPLQLNERARAANTFFDGLGGCVQDEHLFAMPFFPTDGATLRSIAEKHSQRIPGYSKYVQGLLYATGSPEPLKAFIPYNDSGKQAFEALD
ncbi:hypothetical protein C8R46DRAFT_1044588 [Mycena filopes]|nr:hypothetical protein C8R46DRAFT_1044588 [Mycena filopes]